MSVQDPSLLQERTPQHQQSIRATGVVRRETHLAGALRGFMVEVPELLGGVIGEIGELELDGI